MIADRAEIEQDMMKRIYEGGKKIGLTREQARMVATVFMDADRVVATDRIMTIHVKLSKFLVFGDTIAKLHEMGVWLGIHIRSRARRVIVIVMRIDRGDKDNE